MRVLANESKSCRAKHDRRVRPAGSLGLDPKVRRHSFTAMGGPGCPDAATASHRHDSARIWAPTLMETGGLRWAPPCPRTTPFHPRARGASKKSLRLDQPSRG